jgi:hypothetical protein
MVFLARCHARFIESALANGTGRLEPRCAPRLVLRAHRAVAARLCRTVSGVQVRAQVRAQARAQLVRKSARGTS